MLIHYSKQSKLMLLPNKTKDDNQQSVMVWKGKKSSTGRSYKARIKRYRIAICDAKFVVCDVTLILCRKFCDATFACKSAIIGYPCA